MKGSILHRAVTLSLLLGLVLAAVFIAMVQQFAHAVGPHTINKDGNAFDTAEKVKAGIVIATGSEGRLNAGLALMLDHQIEHLLISGTGAGVIKSDILRVANQNGQFDAAPLKQMITCCVELDPAASNTLGNAEQSTQWAEQHDLSTIILVTSDFHMPRALAMFQAAMPDRQIIAHRVATPWLMPDQFGALRWWQSLRWVQIISREMIKYYAYQI